MVICMEATEPPPMEDGRRGLLTTREREIITCNADVSDNYYAAVVSRVRGKIERVGTDAALLQEHHPELFAELQAEVCIGGDTDEQ